MEVLLKDEFRLISGFYIDLFYDKERFLVELEFSSRGTKLFLPFCSFHCIFKDLIFSYFIALIFYLLKIYYCFCNLIL